MFNGGYIKIHRQMLEWEWYSDTNTTRLWLHLLLAANYEDANWRGTIIRRGELVTSLAHLSSETGLTVKQIRLCLERLKSTNEVTIKTTNKYSIISICKYESYQCNDDSEGQAEGQAIGQTKDKQRATIKEEEERKKESISKDIQKKEALDLSIIDPRLLNDFTEYIRMRRQIKKPLKTQRALQDRYKELRELSGGNVAKAQKIIQQSISREWQSFVALKEDQLSITRNTDSRKFYNSQVDEYTDGTI